MKKRYRILISISLLLNIFLTTVLLFYINNKGGKKYFFQQYLNHKNGYLGDIKTTRKEEFDMVETKENSIIMLGDSLTHNMIWDEAFKNTNVINRGISGNTTEDILGGLEEVIMRNPKKIFLMIGINDLAKYISKDKIISNYSVIIDRLINKLPNTTIYIQSILPINTNIKCLSLSNDDIEETNRLIKDIAENKNIEYIDLYKSFIKDGQLNKELTFDGVHLNAKGYTIWISSIKKYVEQ